ncbi:MAG: hypothetical protein LBP29_03925 [Treponema sp.]|jgi:hypothetical protein|nr:hypothetical protein [Treponema sp.]
MIKRRNFLTCLFLLPLLGFMSCDEFFSTSWGSERDYDSSKITLDADNLDSWIEKSIGNPELASALTQKIIEEVQKLPDGGTRVKFQEAGVSLAVEASGVGTSIVSNAAKAIGEIDEKGEKGEQAVKDILKDIQGDFNKNGPKAAKDLAAIVGPSIGGGGTVPEFTGAYASAAKPSDVTQAVLILSLAVLGKEGGDISNTIDGLTEGEVIGGLTLDNSGNRITATDPSPEAKALAAYLNLIATDTTGKFKKDTVTGKLRELFELDD